MVDKSPTSSDVEMVATRHPSLRESLHWTNNLQSTMAGYFDSRPYEHHPYDVSPERRRSSSTDGQNFQSKRRVTLACNRCRKRKIKCSGETLDGAPCINCRTAQYDECRFNRVSAYDTPFRGEMASYEHDSTSGGSFQFESHLPPLELQTQVSVMAPGEGSPHTYRDNSQSPYNASPRYYPVSPYPDYANGHINYDVNSSTFGAYDPANVGMPAQYPSSEESRDWNAAPEPVRNSLYFENLHPEYNQNHLEYHGPTFPVRAVSNHDSPSLSTDGVSTSVTIPVAVSDRMLPVPATARHFYSGSFPRPGEGSLPIVSSTFGAHGSDYLRPSPSMYRSHSASEKFPHAAGLASEQSSSCPSSTDSSRTTHAHEQQNPIYTPTSTDSGSGSFYANDAPAPPYEHTISGSTRALNSRLPTHSNSPVAASTSPAALANGQPYLPYTNGSEYHASGSHYTCTNHSDDTEAGASPHPDPKARN